MKTHWLHKKSSKKCILFMSGWGCDYHPFIALDSSEYDVLMCYDYRDILTPKEIKGLFQEYEIVYLAAWSLGVWVSNILLKQWSELFAQRIAINGTLHPIDDKAGIPPAIFQGTIDQLNDRGRQKFFMRMCGDRSSYQKFQEGEPKRELEEQKEELISLQNAILNHNMDWNLFNVCLIGEQDRIFPANNMEYDWTDMKEIKRENWPHFCFYNWANWDELIKHFE